MGEPLWQQLSNGTVRGGYFSGINRYLLTRTWRIAGQELNKACQSIRDSTDTTGLAFFIFLRLT